MQILVKFHEKGYVVQCFVSRYFVSILVSQSSQLGRERAGCFVLTVFLVSRDCCVATGLSAVCDSGIS